MTFFSPTDCGLERCQPRTMQAHELFRYFRLPELVDFRQYVRTLPTNTLMGFGAFAALTTFWYATRPRALKPPCDLAMQSVEVPVSGTWPPPAFLPPSPVSRPHHGDIQQDHNPKQIFVYQGTLQTEMCSPDRTSAATRGRGQNTGQRDACGGAGSGLPTSRRAEAHPKLHGAPAQRWAVCFAQRALRGEKAGTEPPPSAKKRVASR